MNSNHKPLRMERLEGREMLAADFPFKGGDDLFLNGDISVQGSLLHVTGTNSDDQIIISTTETLGQEYLKAEILGNKGHVIASEEFHPYKITGIQVRGQAGNDLIRNNTNLPATFYGGSGNDHLIGGSNNDHLHGGNDNDTVDGRGGNDTLTGGPGEDRIMGRHGLDKLFGGRDSDTMFGGPNGDIMIGGFGNDRMFGNGDPDWMEGNQGDDVMYGNAGTDQMYGGDGKDRLYGGNDHDRMHGGGDDDRMYGGEDNDTILGEEGHDYIAGNQGQDRMYGGENNDRMYGGEDNDRMYGDQGNDIMVGNDGNDTMQGNEGHDQMWGVVGDDNLKGGEDNDRMYGGVDNDRMYGGVDNDRMYGNEGDDIMHGESGNDRMWGNQGNDNIRGGDDNDQLVGGADHDGLIGGRGLDRYRGSSGMDRFLTYTGDIVHDKREEDARVRFEDGSRYSREYRDVNYVAEGKSWTDSELELMDRAFQDLFNLVGNNELMKLAPTNGEGVNRNEDQREWSCIRHQPLTAADGSVCPIRATNYGSIDTQRYYANNILISTIYHELAHNWDNPNEDALVNDFRAVAGWQEFEVDPGAGWEKGSSAHEYWANWYFRDLDDGLDGFAREYGKTDPREDFATSFAPWVAAASGRSMFGNPPETLENLQARIGSGDPDNPGRYEIIEQFFRNLGFQQA